MTRELTEQQLAEQVAFRDARTNGSYDTIWQTVGRCVFCDLEPLHTVYEENDVLMIVPAYAYIDGHLLIIPKQHYTSIKQLTDAQWLTMRKMFYLAKKMIRKTYGIKGMQIVQKDGREAQSTVEHLHFHCVPFDAPDLSTWNYRQLDHTPYENAEKYRTNNESMRKLAKRYEEKYGSD